ncbi:uncharacterized protein TRAVEDRAFT_45656 [Trametes versicolor FP-101664 SS1]|uniref:uncharacterized protein n=1 Tax=Trametes versicolor (strain FP-101664) TaxID=717944 RepID=UPI0004622E79|nr:uncharacterized protein TRAVEDRAFT_45656 [Trametes versicolor FP-101664 SS1]EIW60405.1 hypothetical protein TRAVEDRAFT_45656 [Trametes versicolor FP-101664 SS1]
MHSPSEEHQDVYHYQYKPSPHSFQPFVFPCDRQFPIYAHCNSQRKRKTPRLRCNTTHPMPIPPQRDLMQTVDHRYAESERPARSSFALSDIFESDEEDVEIEISPVLPSTPNTANSVSTSKSARIRMKSLFTGVAYSVKATWDRARSSRK